MDGEEFSKEGKLLIDYIVNYLENIRERRVFPDKKPGFIREQIPDCAPIDGEKWSAIFSDVEKIIMPGVTHWQSPHMHAYFPALNSYPSMLGEMIANSINCLGFTWASSPACTELEMVVMNWLAKMIGLPDDYLHKKGGTGGGVIQTTASESTLISLLAGRYVALKLYMDVYPEASKHEIHGKLVAYCSDQAHSSIEKAALIGLVTLRYIESDENFSMRGEDLLRAIKQDRENGLIPFWVCATLGTTGSCAFDNLEEITEITEKELLWCHVDAAYAGSAFICPEHRIWLKGIEHANSFAFNPSKWLMVHFDCTAMWVKNSGALHGAFNVNPLYLTHEYSGGEVLWQMHVSRLKFENKGDALVPCSVKHQEKYGRPFKLKYKNANKKGVQLAEKFESLLKADNRFQIPSSRYLGLVVFRLVGDNVITEALWKRINARGKIHCVPASLKGKYVIRFTVTSPRTTVDDIVADWKEIFTVTDELLKENVAYAARTKVPLAETKDKNENFGTSLLLSNIPTSPKIVNGSFAAIYDQGDVLDEFLKTIKFRKDAKESPAMRRRIKGILMSGKQFSLDSRLDLFHGIEQTSRSETSEKLPLLEDSNETEDTSLAESDFECLQFSSSEPLDLPYHGQSRSKSVDHQANNFLKMKQICNKCGHLVNGCITKEQQ